jgi:hypothetical protein
MNKIVEEITRKFFSDNAPIDELDLRHLRPYIESFINPNWLEDRLHEYEKWAKKYSDPVLQRNLLHRPIGMNILIALIWAARSWEKEYKVDSSYSPKGAVKRLINIAISMAILELNASKYLDSSARRYIQQRLQAADQFLGLTHEIYTYAHFAKKGAKLEPNFLRRGSRSEITAYYKGFTIPIQCKAKQPGAGRLISQDSFTTLAGSIARDAKVAGRRLLVIIGTTGPIRQRDIDFLRKQVSMGVGLDIAPALVKNEQRLFSLKVRPISGNFTASSVQSYLSSFGFHIGMVVGEPITYGSGYDVNAVVGIEADPDEGLLSWRSLRDSMKYAAKQLEGGPPGIIAIHYSDPVDDFKARFLGSYSQLFETFAQWPHVTALMLSSEPIYQLPKSDGTSTIKSYVKKTCGFAELLGEII